MIVQLQGGLGNQLFQWAFGRSVGGCRNEEVYYDRSLVDADVQRSYSLSAVGLDLQFARPEGPSYVERGMCYDPGVYAAPFSSVFTGYWQSEKYFDVNTVRQELDFSKSKIGTRSREVMKQVRATNSVFIHVRRGDKLSARDVAVHGAFPEEYYRKAIECALDHVNHPHFFIFSDDMLWCRENILLKNATFVDHNVPGNGCWVGHEHEDLWLMSGCRHAIAGRSSFSWWGAWLGEQQEGHVTMAPQAWFADPTFDDRDLIPKGWIRL